MRFESCLEAESGVEGLPMTLVVTMIVIAITVPLIFGGFRAYDRARVETELVSEIGKFMSAVQLLYASGPGNSAVLGFSAANGALSTVDSVIIGDVPGGALSAAVRYTISGRPEAMIPMSSPGAPMYSPACDGGLLLAGGEYEIIAECLTTPTDLNGDSLVPDAYICLSLSV